MLNKKERKLSQTFQRWLLVVVVIALGVTAAFLWVFQTRISEQNAIDLLTLNITDVKQDILDASDEKLLELAHDVADHIQQLETVDTITLLDMLGTFHVTEINIIDSNGIIIHSTYSSFPGYDMASGTQSAEFMCLLNGEEEYVQVYQPTSFDPYLYRKYAGTALQNGGFVQVGYDAQHFQSSLASQVIGVTRNRHVGQGGSIIVIDEMGHIVSDRMGNEGKFFDVIGLEINETTTPANTCYSGTVYGEECYCMYSTVEGYYIAAVMPKSEAVLSRNVSVGITTAMEVLVFAALFMLIYILVKRLIVDNIHRINGSLAEITGGNLDVVVDVRSHEEFSSLSDDINSTVNTLKRYIADAAARIDAELEFAKAIQHSALPSMFPPYPNHSEFDLFSCMYTAKEVGGDFYDFYFVDEDRLAFLVADVSGKGIPAAMFMMTAKTLLNSYAESGMSAEDVFTHANEKLCEGNDTGMFVTAWMGFLNIRTGLVTFANAGHNPPLVRHADGSFTYLKTRAGFVLAGMEGIRYRKNELQLEPGDVIYLYTDGVTEATDLNNELYGEDRLLAVLNQHADSDMQALCAAVKADVDAFVGEAPQFDDITMTALRFHGKE